MVPTAWIYSIQFGFWSPQLHQHLHPHATYHLGSNATYQQLLVCFQTAILLLRIDDIVSGLKKKKDGSGVPSAVKPEEEQGPSEANDWLLPCLMYLLSYSHDYCVCPVLLLVSPQPCHSRCYCLVDVNAVIAVRCTVNICHEILC